MPNRLVSMELTGADGLIDLLRTLPEKEILPAASQGMRASGTKTMRDARKHLRKGHGVETGQYRKSLGVRSIKIFKREGRIVMYTGPRRGYGITKANKKKHDPFYIGHLLEYGHRIAGSSDIVQPIRHLRPAVDANKADYPRQIETKVRARLEKVKARGK